MDVIGNARNHMDAYQSWLEVALRAEVVCNAAFFRKFGEIERYVLTKAHGLLDGYATGDALQRQFDKLAQTLQAVAEKYDISDNFLRRYFGDRKY